MDVSAVGTNIYTAYNATATALNAQAVSAPSNQNDELARALKNVQNAVEEDRARYLANDYFGRVFEFRLSQSYLTKEPFCQGIFSTCLLVLE